MLPGPDLQTDTDIAKGVGSEFRVQTDKSHNEMSPFGKLKLAFDSHYIAQMNVEMLM